MMSNFIESASSLSRLFAPVVHGRAR
jgi:hypothetical protein